MNQKSFGGDCARIGSKYARSTKDRLLKLSILISPLLLSLPAGAQDASQTTVGSNIAVDSGLKVFYASDLKSAASLNVAAGATAVIDVSGGQAINFSGNINNAGSIYAVSTNHGVTAANIGAQNIFNNAGGILSSVAPTTLLNTMPNLIGNLSLNLSAVNNIINAGTISSSANLAMTAGDSIVNSGPI
ncbi:MAG: hypothetical protein K2X27_20975, partial [Candidatus Obscuribacterales bacterium]|nr:hypothetical protein [Candidatus Obscuribacterales bacterium]